MILKLRKRHRYIWIVLSVLLPLGFALALANRPGPVLPEEELIEEAAPYKEREVIATAAAEGWRVNICRSPDGRAWLEAIFREASQRPASTLYLAARAGAGPDEAIAIGPVGPRGFYQYPLDTLVASWKEYQVFFYDQVRRETYSETLLKKSS
ncbi:MAG: hypothetical protein KDD10_12145 [Phaeodactylibacter sp.]|nr:hypothetical protein [Phaeodactylibacter sp.]